MRYGPLARANEKLVPHTACIPVAPRHITPHNMLHYSPMFPQRELLPPRRTVTVQNARHCERITVEISFEIEHSARVSAAEGQSYADARCMHMCASTSTFSAQAHGRACPRHGAFRKCVHRSAS